jgi:protein-S-isoprenylcysteine O-methyltransferase Ste14
VSGLAPRAAGDSVRPRLQSVSCARPLNFTVRSRMLIRAIAAFVALPGIVAFALPIAIGTSAGRPVQHVAIAAAVLGLGTLLLLWCVREFYVAGRGTLAPWAPPKHLVTTGPYRRSRNPMYVGVITILIGWSILWDSRTLLICTLVVAAAVYVRVLLAEEPWAARNFGAEWKAYRARVPRWFI